MNNHHTDIPPHPISQPIKHKTKILLIVILFAALRLPVFTWGLPLPEYTFHFYHPDERKILQVAVEFPASILTNQDLRYPTLLHNLLGTAIYPFHRWMSHSPTKQYRFAGFMGRGIVFILALATLYLVFVFATELFGSSQGLLAALWLSLSLYHAQSSVWATTDVPLAFMTTLFAWLTWRLTSTSNTSPPTISAYALTGWVFGWVVGMKYTGIIAGIIFLILYITESIDHTSSRTATFKKIASDKKLRIFAIASLVAFLISTPGIFLHPSYFYKAILFESQRLSQGYLPPFHPLTWVHLAQKLATAVGWPLALSLGISLLFNSFLGPRISRALAATIWATLLIFGDALLPRYYIFILPLWSILAAHTWIKITQHPYIKKWAQAWIVLVSVYALIYAAQGIRSRFPETRTLAAKYVMQHFPQGATLGFGYVSPVFGWSTHSWRYPPIDLHKFQETDFLQHPQIVILTSYEVRPILRTLTLGKDSTRHWYRNEAPPPQVLAFYKEVFLTHQSEYCLATFFPSPAVVPIEFPPPDIWILVRKDLYPAKQPCRLPSQ